MGWAILGSSPVSGTEPVYGGKVVIGATGGLAPLNPVITQATVAVNVFDVLFERLLKETVTGELAPGVAVSWASSDEHKTWDFKLREDVRFHDGVPLTAADVVFTFRLLQQYRGRAGGATGGVPFESMEAVDPYTVRVHFAQAPNASFLYQMREHILPRHVLEPQLQAGPITDISFNQQPVGSGPYRFAGWAGEGQLVLAAFAGYFGDRPRLDSVVVRADYEDSRSLWVGLMKGEVDVVPRISPADVKSLAENEAFAVVRGYSPSYIDIDFNCRKASLAADRHVRRALSYAIDRQAIWRLLGGTEGAAETDVFPLGPFVPGSSYNDPAVEAAVCDPQKAVALLEEVGWQDADGDGVREKGGRALELSLLMPREYPYCDAAASQLRKDLEEVGARLHVRTAAFTQLESRAWLEGQGFDLLWAGHTFFADPDLCVSRWHTVDGRNFSGYADADVDRLIEQARFAYDGQQQVQTYRLLHRRLAEDVPGMLFCRAPLLFVVRKGLEGTQLLARIGLFRSLPTWYWAAHTNPN
jgi:peptide/nickel transport system substrate-binding protein